MNTQILKEFLTEIKTECVNSKIEDEQYREIAIFIKDVEDSINIVIDKSFEFHYHEDTIFLKWESITEATEETPKSSIIYRHVFNISDIYYITDEV